MKIRSVNIARELVDQPYVKQPTGIGKEPVDGAVEVRAPGPRRGGLGSGLAGDRIGNSRYHGGDDQAVYAFSREVLDEWQERLGRDVPDGGFGENLTTEGIDVDNVLLGERWRVGETVVLQVTNPRVPCNTFRGWIDERGWLRKFTEDARCGAYFKVITGGRVQAGDEITVIERPEHGVTMSLAFRALMGETELRPVLLDAEPYLTARLRKAAR